MNQVVLIGRLTKDPEIRVTRSGQKSCTFDLAVNRPKDKNGNQQADFIRCVCWGVTAENLAKYQAKGSQIAVSGRIQTGSYENRNGQKVYTTDVYVQNIQFLESRKDVAPKNGYQNAYPQQNGYQQGNMATQNYSYQPQGYGTQPAQNQQNAFAGADLSPIGDEDLPF